MGRNWINCNKKKKKKSADVHPSYKHNDQLISNQAIRGNTPLFHPLFLPHRDTLKQRVYYYSS